MVRETTAQCSRDEVFGLIGDSDLVKNPLVNYALNPPYVGAEALTEIRRDVEDHVGAADPNPWRRSRADVGTETVQQQVHAADRSLNSAVRFLWSRHPAKRSAAGAPGEVPPLRREET